MIRYEWDERKCLVNIEKHNVNFSVSLFFDWGKALTAEDTRNNYQEERFVSIAPIKERLFIMIWTPRGDLVRLISLRKANNREVKEYERKKT